MLAQDTPTEPPPEDSGLDPVTTPAPLPTREPRPAVFAVTNDDRAGLQTFFIGPVPQGETRLLRVVGDDIESVTANWLNEVITFWPAEDNNFYGLLATAMEAPTGSTTLSVVVTYADGTQSTLATSLDIVNGAFITQNVNIPANRGYLLDASVERSELARLESAVSQTTLERLWDSDGFHLPIMNAFRVFNGTLSTRHTGTDIRTTLGVSVNAMGGGRVAYTGLLPIRGNYVLIDHGYGVFSGYAHCTEVLVEYGDPVERGQTVCISGDTGRTQGPHFHWETTVNGVCVSPIQLLQMWMP